ncbi:MAG TPA: hypothetical protein VKT73_13090 [Xanthobacteraceae bacterium]|nr:hypothetical protein [Xanthobacteraceae bacterium]
MARKFLLSLKSFVDERDLIFLIGLGLICYGCALIYLPMAYIVPGAILVHQASARQK